MQNYGSVESHYGGASRISLTFGVRQSLHIQPNIF